MQRGFKYLFIITICFFIIFITENIYALSDKACGIILGEKIVVTIKFDTDGAQKINDLNYCYDCGSSSFKLPIPKRKGYKFDGWYADKNYTKKLNNVFNKNDDRNMLEIVPDEFGCNVRKAHTTIYAKWLKEGEVLCSNSTENNITIKFDTDGGEKVEPLVICEDCEDVKVSLPIPTKEKSVFIGWYLEKGKLNKVSDGMIDSYDIYSDMDLKDQESSDNCSNNRYGILYARWMTNDEFLNSVIDLSDNTFHFSHELVNG